MKTFDDLVFEPHSYKGEQAKMYFENGFGISVLFGEAWYSDGNETYEVGILRHGKLCYSTGIAEGDAVIGYKTKEEITEIMRKLQEFSEDIVFEEDRGYKDCDFPEQICEEGCDSPIESCEEKKTVTRNYVLDLEILIAEESSRKLARMESRVIEAFRRAKEYHLLPGVFVGMVPTDSYAGIMLRENEGVKIMYLPSHTNKLDALQNLAKELIERIKHYNKSE